MFVFELMLQKIIARLSQIPRFPRQIHWLELFTFVGPFVRAMAHHRDFGAFGRDKVVMRVSVDRSVDVVLLVAILRRQTEGAKIITMQLGAFN